MARWRCPGGGARWPPRGRRRAPPARSPPEDGGIGSHPLPPPGGRTSPLSLVDESRPHPRPLCLSSLARPPPPPAPLQARGGVALPVEDRGDPAATATGLPPVSPYIPTPLAEAASARLSPPPTADPKPPPGPSGLGPPARRRVRCRIAATPLPQLLLPGSGYSSLRRGGSGSPPGYSERVHTVAAPPAAGVEAVAGAVGTVAALAAQTPGVEPLGRPHDPAWGGASGDAPCPCGGSSRGSTRRPSTPLVRGGLALVSPRGGGGPGPGFADGPASPSCRSAPGPTASSQPQEETGNRPETEPKGICPRHAEER